MKTVNISIPVRASDSTAQKLRQSGTILLWDENSKTFYCTTYTELFSSIDARMKDLERLLDEKCAEIETFKKDTVETLKSGLSKLTALIEAQMSEEK